MRLEIDTMNEEWTQEWPTEPGLYWFYSYRYGMISCGFKQKPKLMMMAVSKCANGFMYTADGQFVFDGEPEHAWFTKVITPDLPVISDGEEQ